MKSIITSVLLVICEIIYSQEKFITIPSGIYIIGSEQDLHNPKQKVKVDSFKISIFEITNEQFLLFTTITGYKTQAEIKKNALVFRWGLKDYIWQNDTTANWRFPNGFSYGSIDSIMNHPVTTISYIDALEYCKWSNTRLPSIIEWEVASKGHMDSKFFFGYNEKLIYQYANVWEGKTHSSNFTKDYYIFTSPVGKFKPNQFGLFDIYGNVFEFCTGFILDYDNANDNIIHTRGGSWWCSQYSCSAYNSWVIGSLNAYASFSNVGFRVCEK
jgi:sulfatase modifying factor 1